MRGSVMMVCVSVMVDRGSVIVDLGVPICRMWVMVVYWVYYYFFIYIIYTCLTLK